MSIEIDLAAYEVHRAVRPCRAHTGLVERQAQARAGSPLGLLDRLRVTRVPVRSGHGLYWMQPFLRR